jgi:hypothetical protein
METGDIVAMKNWVGVTNEDAKAIDDELRAMQGRLKRPPTIEDIVTEAKSEKSPFHKHLTWDDQQAATAHRRDQARKIMRAIGYVVGGDDEPIILRAYMVVKPAPKHAEKLALPMTLRSGGATSRHDADEAQAPMPQRRRDEVMSDPELRAQHLRSVVGRIAQYIPELEQFGDETRDLRRAIARLQQSLDQKEKHTASARQLPETVPAVAV